MVPKLRIKAPNKRKLVKYRWIIMIYRATGTVAQPQGETVGVPATACWKSEDAILPYSTAERLQTLADSVRRGRVHERPLVIRSEAEGGFEVIYGWDVVLAYRDAGITSVPAILITDTVHNRLYWGVIKQAELLGLGWTSIARALVVAKDRHNLSNEMCGDATLLGRTTVSRYTNIVHKLHPDLFTMAERNRLTYSSCRKLITLPASRQAALADEATKKALDNQAIMRLAFPKAQSANQVVAQTEQQQADTGREKSVDIKRLEILLSEKIGYPIEITPSAESESKGQISCQFFDRQGMIDALTQFRRGFTSKAQVRGKFLLTFDSLEEFDHLTRNHFAESD